MYSLAQSLCKIGARARPILPICLYGLVGSLAAVGFQLSIEWVYYWFYRVPSAGGMGRFALITLAVSVGTSLLAGWLVSLCPEAGGSGIPQSKLAFWKEFGYAPRRVAFFKFAAGVIGIGGGQSLGNEGPSVQIGSSLASTVAGFLGISKPHHRAANAAGSAAGLAAAFNAPLAAVAFVLEEIIGDLNSRFIGGVLLAAVIGAFVVHAIIGAQPAFELAVIREPTWRAYLLMPLAAGLAALVGVYFQRFSLGLRARVNTLSLGHGIPRALLPLGGGLITWAIGVGVFAATGRLGVFSLGYSDLNDALAHGMGWKLAGVLLLGKLAASVCSYGFGGAGGIFAPNLFFGAMCGTCLAGVCSHFLALSPADTVVLAVGGMSACLGAVMQTPVTAILIIFEMTHQFALVPGLMLAGLVSQVIARSINRVNFYEGVLLQDGHHLERLIPPRDLQSWQRLAISAIAQFQPVVIADASEAALGRVLREHPYRYFPVVEQGTLAGLASRVELEAALAAHRPPKWLPAVTCRPGDIIQEVQNRFIESPVGFLVLTDTDGPGAKVLGIVTLHDVLRAQVAMSERENG